MCAYHRVIDVSTFLGTEGEKLNPVAKIEEEEDIVCWCLWGKPSVLKRVFALIVLMGVIGIAAYDMIGLFVVGSDSFWFWYYVVGGFVVLFLGIMMFLFAFRRWRTHAIEAMGAKKKGYNSGAKGLDISTFTAPSGQVVPIPVAISIP
jgi:hypothetical protein